MASKSSVAFPVRRVSSLTDLRESKGQVKSNLKSCKSEGNVSSTEFVASFDASQGSEFSVNNYTGQQLHTNENDVELAKLQTTSDEKVRTLL